MTHTEWEWGLKGGMSQAACANLTLYQLHYEYLREDVVQIAYTPLEASVVVIREVCGCTPIRARLTVRIITTRYLLYNDLGLRCRGQIHATTHAQ